MAKTFKPLNRLRQLNSQNIFQRRKGKLSFCLFIEQLEEDGWKVSNQGHLLFINNLTRNFWIIF